MTIEGIVFEERGIDHHDHRRDILTAFNKDLGDFVARQVKFAEITENKDVSLGGHYHNYRGLFYMLEGEATFYLKSITTGNEKDYELKKGTRLLIPPGVAHKADVKRGSILVECTTKPYGKKTPLTVFNGDFGGFVARQVKFAIINKKEDVILGGHYHDYRELFYMLKGEATFHLKDIITEGEKNYNLKEGTRLLILPKIAHKAEVKRGSILVGCTEKPYISPEVNDKKYDL